MPDKFNCEVALVFSGNSLVNTCLPVASYILMLRLPVCKGSHLIFNTEDAGLGNIVGKLAGMVLLLQKSLDQELDLVL